MRTHHLALASQSYGLHFMILRLTLCGDLTCPDGFTYRLGEVEVEGGEAEIFTVCRVLDFVLGLVSSRTF